MKWGSSGLHDEKLLGLWFNSLLRFPLFHCGWLHGGAVFAVRAFYMAFTHCNQEVCESGSTHGLYSTMSAIVFIGGMLMLMLGLVGEYIGRIYISINHSHSM